MKQFMIIEKYGQKGVMIHDTELFEEEFKMAIEMVHRWGMVAGVDAGEDSSGRAKVRLATPEEVVTRAFTCVNLLLQGARDRGLIVKVPDLSELNPPRPTLPPKDGTDASRSRDD